MENPDHSKTVSLFRAWLRRGEQGRGEDFSEFLARHPECARELRVLRTLHRVHARANPEPTSTLEFLRWLHLRSRVED